MSDKAQATDTPWTVVEVKTASGLAYKIGSGEMLDVGKGCCIIYDDYPGNRPSPHRKKADRIVAAVNSHEPMKEALKRAKQELDMAADQLHTLAHFGHAEDIRITIEVLEEALLLAEGDEQ